MITNKRVSSTLSLKKRKRQRTQTRVNPWKDAFELDFCGQELLLASDICERIENDRIDNALQLVQTWNLRSNEKLPHAIDTTYYLALVLWKDLACGHSELRSSYAMALIRGINGLADILQQQRSYAGSVANLCAEWGLPPWLVDIRHDAAHNELPSLPTLRLAAQTFLSFLGERFWKPLKEAHAKQRKEAAQLLMDYKAAAKKEIAVDNTERVTEIVPIPIDDDDGNDDNDDDDDDSSGEGEPENPTEMDLLWGRNVGKTLNRFAALEEKKKEKKKKPPKRVKRKVALSPSTLVNLAMKYTKTVPMDVGIYVTLSFLIWSGVGDASSGRGALVPTSETTFPANQDGVDRIRQRYKPLFFILAQVWPGFIPTIIVHLVDCCLSIEAKDDFVNSIPQRQLFFLTSWIRFSLSRDFHRCHDRSLSLMTGSIDLGKRAVSSWSLKERTFMEEPAPLNVLQLAKVPLNSLCDRCTEANGTTGLELASLFSTILGHERSYNYGTDIVYSALSADKASPKDAEKDSDADSNVNADADSFKSAMETLGTDDKGSGHKQYHSDILVDKHIAVIQPPHLPLSWTQCSSWDPCAIGSFPGRPV